MPDTPLTLEDLLDMASEIGDLVAAGKLPQKDANGLYII